MNSFSTIEDLRLSPLGNSERFVEQHGAKVRFNWASKTWFAFDGYRWKRDEGQIQRRAIETVKSITEEARKATSDAAQEILKHAGKSLSENAIQQMIRLAQSDERILVQAKDFDANPWLLNVSNGTLDLKTGVLFPHRSEDMITRLIDVEWDPDAECPRWESFIDTVTNGDQDLGTYLGQSVGYSLTGNTGERVLYFLVGSGANGKTAFLQTIAMMLGEYSASTPPDSILYSKGDRISNDIARLNGKRFVFTSETGMGRALDEARIKILTGGDTVTVRFLYNEFFEMTPMFKLWIATNHTPRVSGADNAMWDRIRVIPFNKRFETEEQVPLPELMRDFKAELPGILAWAVRGCQEWNRDGLQTPEQVINATQEYREEMNSFAQFFAEHCWLDPDGSVQSSQLKQKYDEWRRETGTPGIGYGEIKRYLLEQGVQEMKSNVMVYKGLSVSYPDRPVTPYSPL